MLEPQSQQTTSATQNNLFFDPDAHPEATLKAFTEFAQVYELRYDAQFPDPPTVSFEAALKRWKITNTTAETPDPSPTLAQYDQIREEWKSRDRVTKFVGMFSSVRFQADWRNAQPDENI